MSDRSMAMARLLPLLLLLQLACPCLAFLLSSPTRLPHLSPAASSSRLVRYGRKERGLALRPALTVCASSDGLLSWASENGAKLTCAVGPGGMTLTQDVKSNSVVCSIPSKLFLSRSTTRAAFGSMADKLDVRTAMALQILYEKSKKEESFWCEWLKVLPDRENLGTPCLWPEDDQNLLKGTSVFEEVEASKSLYSKAFESLSSSGWDSKIPTEFFNLESFEWAMEVVRSRSVAFPKFDDGLVLAPVADFSLAGKLGRDTISCGYEGLFREPRVTVQSVAGGKSGSPIAVNFMGKSPSSMLLDHGVANPNKEEGEFKVSFAVSSLDRFFDDKADILEQEGLTTEMTFTLKADGTLDEYLLPFMRLVCIQSFDAFLLESVFRQEVWGFVNLPVSKDNEKLMLETLIATFEGALDDIGSSESEDMSIVRDASSTYRQVQAAYVRIGERSALKKTIYLLEQEMEEMDSKEYYQERRLKSLNLDRPVDESEIVDPNVEFGRERDAPWMR